VFAIELLIVRNGTNPVIIDRATCASAALADAAKVAKTLLDRARRMRPHNPPDGYRIVDDMGTVLLRSWEQQL
jgi:hypothetical protein